MLLDECDAAGVRIETDCAIAEVQKNDAFVVNTGAGSYSSDAVVVATGGLSIPKMGASGLGFDIARQFGLHVYDTRAGLVPFTFAGALHDMMTRLSGVSTNATLATGSVAFTESILFTHRGLSGPAALQISSYWEPGDVVVIDLLAGDNAIDWLLKAKSERPRALLRKLLTARLPRRLVIELQELWWPRYAETALAEISNDVLTDIGRRMNQWTVKPAATEGYRTAEVTLGGIDTNELSSQTMASKKVPGLYFVGEVVDVTGHLGGFNFQWAWASGYVAGNAL